MNLKNEQPKAEDRRGHVWNSQDYGKDRGRGGQPRFSPSIFDDVVNEDPSENWLGFLKEALESGDEGAPVRLRWRAWLG